MRGSQVISDYLQGKPLVALEVTVLRKISRGVYSAFLGTRLNLACGLNGY